MPTLNKPETASAAPEDRRLEGQPNMNKIRDAELDKIRLDRLDEILKLRAQVADLAASNADLLAACQRLRVRATLEKKIRKHLEAEYLRIQGRIEFYE